MTQQNQRQVKDGASKLSKVCCGYIWIRLLLERENTTILDFSDEDFKICCRSDIEANHHQQQLGRVTGDGEEGVGDQLVLQMQPL